VRHRRAIVGVIGMGTITSGVGLISGIDITSIVDQLMSLEARPRDLLIDHQATVDAQRTAMMDISAQILAMKVTAGNIRNNNQLSIAQATSSNTNLIAATAANGAANGTYQFRVGRTVTTQQLISNGFADTTTAQLSAGSITVQSVEAKLVDDMSLDLLNAQAGVQHGSIRITDRSGTAEVIDLSMATTVQDVLDAINATTTISVQATASGDNFVLTDLTGQSASNLIVTEVGIGQTAADLGIVGSVAANTLSGQDIVTVSATTSLGLINHGMGLRSDLSSDDLEITLKDGNSYTVDLSSATTLGDVLTKLGEVTTASGGLFTAAINASSTGLTLTDTSAGGSTFAVAAIGDSLSAVDLGILQSDTNADGIINGLGLMGGLQDVQLSRLNGGDGVGRGSISITDRDGTASTIDLSEASTIQDVIDAINAGGVTADVTAALNASGNGLVITDNTGGAGNLIIVNVGGATTATDLGIVVNDAVDSQASGDLNRMFINGNTSLENLGGGQGVASGKFRITDSLGVSAEVDLTQGNEVTLQDVIDEINSKATSVTAGINATGDGLLLTDTGGGGASLTVENTQSTTATDLGIAGTASGVTIDGTTEVSITVAAGDSLNTLLSAINSSDAQAEASILNDGSAQNPYRVSLVASRSGAAGAMMIDVGATGLSLSEMARGRDAVISVGDGTSGNPLLITSSSNTVTGVIDDVTLDLVGSDPDATVTVTVTSNTTAVTASVQNLVADFNGVLEKINTYTSFDSEAMTGAILQGNSTLIQTQSRLMRLVFQSYPVSDSRYTSMSSIGFKREDGQLALDESKFAEVFQQHPDDVRNLLLDTENGFIAAVRAMADTLSETGTGSLSIQADRLETQSNYYTSRIEEMNERLELKRERLTMQFINMERALARMQVQQAALTSLASLAASSWNSRSSRSSS
jgi:flagellar hook-associated protein 2